MHWRIRFRYVIGLLFLFLESILSGSHDTTIRGWDISDGSCFIEWKAHESGVSCIKAVGDMIYR